MKWKERFPNDLEKVANEESIGTINALLTVNVLKNVHKEFIEDPDDCGFFVLYGYLPQLALCYIGANLASSFCECVNSCAKNIMTHDRTMLSDHHLGEAPVQFCRIFQNGPLATHLLKLN